MKLERFDKLTANALVARLNAALKGLGEMYGVTLNINGGSIQTPTAMKLNLEATIAGTASVRLQRASDDLRRYRDLYLPGVDLEQLYAHLTLGLVRITGFNARAPKLPVLVTAEDGKVYRMTVDSVKRMTAHAPRTA
jgi:hypothetical protein